MVTIALLIAALVFTFFAGMFAGVTLIAAALTHREKKQYITL